MSQGGTQGGSTIVGLPNNSTSPGMGGLGIGGGIYGNPFQVNQMSQPNALQGSSGLMRSPFNPMGQGQPMQPGGQLFNQMNQAQQMPLMGRVSQMDLMNQMNQMPLMGRMGQGQLMQPGGQLFNQPQSMNYGLGSLLPGNYASRR